MVRIESFKKYFKEYDEWFDKNQNIYLAELYALKSLVPSNKFGIDIGVGTGRFALPLNIKLAIEPSGKMAEISKKLGIQVYKGVAENLPFKKKIFDFIIFVTTICFVDNLEKTFTEAYRVLKNNGFIIVGFIDKESKLGKKYQLKKIKSKFYKEANFFSVKEVIDILRKTKFKDMTIKQTVFTNKNDKFDNIDDGYGKGSFVIIKANKS